MCSASHGRGLFPPDADSIGNTIRFPFVGQSEALPRDINSSLYPLSSKRASRPRRHYNFFIVGRIEFFKCAGQTGKE
jgi:hypothetical protein